MKIALILKILVYALFFFLQGESYKEKELLVWDNNSKISWEDFKGHNKNSNLNANTSSIIYSKYESSSKQDLVLSIRACFIKKESWKRDKKPSDNLLNHEQKHFDITEVFARKLRKSLTDTVFASLVEAKKSIPKLIKANNQSWKAFQVLYDKDTNHSEDKEKQLEWGKKIEKELESLNKYETTLVTIKAN